MTMTKIFKTYFTVVLLLGLMFACGSKDDPSPLTVEADFTSNRTNITRGQSVTFTSSINTNVSTWAWTADNGNGTVISSSDQNPVITFNTTGNYDITLTVTSSDGSTDTETKTDFISVSPGEIIIIGEF